MHKLAAKAETLERRKRARERERGRKGERTIEKKRMNKRACEQRSHIHMYISHICMYIHTYLLRLCMLATCVCVSVCVPALICVRCKGT